MMGGRNVSKPRYGWWGYVKNMTYRYPELCTMHEQSLCQQITPAYVGQPCGGRARRTVEEVMARAMTRADAKEYEAVHRAVRETRQLADGAERLQLIRLIYWKRSHTMTGAALELHVSIPTAKRWHGEFIRRVARNYGLLD